MYLGLVLLALIHAFGLIGVHGGTFQTSPNIIFFLLDDAGWSDFSYNNASWTLTPNIYNLAVNEGIILTNNYVQSWCIPTRAAFLTGRYPVRFGFQDHGINVCSPVGLPLEETLFPQLLKEYGNYDTYMVGKWHLGYYTTDYFPQKRGFDHYYGYEGNIDRFTLERTLDLSGILGIDLKFTAIDFRNDDEYVTNDDKVWIDYFVGNHSLNDILSNKYINQSEETYNSNNPFFLYLALGSPHGPNQATSELENRYFNYNESSPNAGGDVTNDIANEVASIMRATPGRATSAGMMTGADDVIGQITDALKSDINNIWENTLVVVMTDNGATQKELRSNYPLRGSKKTLYEGGTKSPGFISGGILNRYNNSNSNNNSSESLIGGINNDLIHITDWYLTFLGLINNTNINTTQIGIDLELDGFDFSSRLFEIDDVNSPYNETRNTMLYNLNINKLSPSCESTLLGIKVCGAIRWNQWKLAVGNQLYDLNKEISGWHPDFEDYGTDGELMKQFSFNYINCNRSNEPQWNETYFANQCPFNNEACLFDLDNDPCEYFDVKNDYPEIYDKMVQLFVDYANGEYGYIDEPSLGLTRVWQYDFPVCLPSFNFSDHWLPWLPWTSEYTLFVVMFILMIVTLLYVCALCCHPTCVDILLFVFVIVVTIAIIDDWHMEMNIQDDVSDLYFRLNSR